MEFITSRSFALPTDKGSMEEKDWFNMWTKKNYPYSELLVGDILYWLDTTKQTVVWKTRVQFVERFEYNDKKEVLKRYKNSGSIGQKYIENSPDKGYFLYYKIKVITRTDKLKPFGTKFPHLGWLRVDNEVSKKWFDTDYVVDEAILDDNVSVNEKSLADILNYINKKMQNVSPERVQKLISTSIRKDSKIINAIKKVADFKCQYPSCGHQIKKRDGSFYIEVAHIKSVASGGQSILGNLLVLCPNHHKEFDHGHLSVAEQTPTKISGQLNGRQFQIDLHR
jgi:hypothetical protein